MNKNKLKITLAFIGAVTIIAAALLIGYSSIKNDSESSRRVDTLNAEQSTPTGATSTLQPTRNTTIPLSDHVEQPLNLNVLKLKHNDEELDGNEEITLEPGGAIILKKINQPHSGTPIKHETVPSAVDTESMEAYSERLKKLRGIKGPEKSITINQRPDNSENHEIYPMDNGDPNQLKPRIRYSTE